MKAPSRGKKRPDRSSRAAPRAARATAKVHARHRNSRAAAGSTPLASPRPAPGGPAAYLYGIVKWPLPWAATPDDVGRSVGAGVGEPPGTVTAVPHRGLAAMISRVHPASIGSGQGVRGLRRDMRAHANVLNRIVALGGTVLPAAFGLMFPQADLLAARFLEPQYATLAAQTARLEDAVEVTLKAAYVEARAIQDVVAESPQLSVAVGRRGRSLDSKIELGRKVALALRAKRDRDARLLVSALSPAARDVKVGNPAADTVVLNASFLVPRKSMPDFDRALEEVSRAARGRLQFDCVGPLPPYSFVDLRL